MPYLTVRAAIYHNSLELTRRGGGQGWRIYLPGVAVFLGGKRLKD